MASQNAWQTKAPRLPSIGPPIPTHDSIQALRGASLSAMNAPINGMKTGAPTLSPNFLATSKCPVSCTNSRTTNPSAKGQPHFFFQAEDGIRDLTVTGVQTCALPI